MGPFYGKDDFDKEQEYIAYFLSFVIPDEERDADTTDSELIINSSGKKRIDSLLREKSKKEIVIWLDDDDGVPAGIIVKKVRNGSEMASTG